MRYAIRNATLADAANRSRTSDESLLCKATGGIAILRARDREAGQRASDSSAKRNCESVDSEAKENLKKRHWT